MAKTTKKKKISLMNLIMSAIGIVGAVLSFIALVFNFVNTQSVTKIGSGTRTTNDPANLSEWFEFIDKAQEANAEAHKLGGKDVIDINGWATARVFLIITLVLVALVAIAMVVKFFINNKILNWTTLVVAGLTVLSALVFLIMVYVGGSPFNTEVADTTTKVLADVGAWFVTVGAVIAGAMGIVVARK